jgi:HK97 family phage prohead protease
MNLIDLRFCERELRAVNSETDGRHIRGYAALFNTPTMIGQQFREILRPGCFDRSLTTDVRCLSNHDARLVLGRTSAGTLTLRTDDIGLYYDCVPPDAQWANDLMISINRGDVSGCSFSFTTTPKTGDSWAQEAGMMTREVLDVDNLYDVGPVTYPAYPDTWVAARTMATLEEFQASARARLAADETAERDARARHIHLLSLTGGTNQC